MPSSYQQSMWRQIEPQLICRCGAANSPRVTVIKIDDYGKVACDQCGRGGEIPDFRRTE